MRPPGPRPSAPEPGPAPLGPRPPEPSNGPLPTGGNPVPGAGPLVGPLAGGPDPAPPPKPGTGPTAPAGVGVNPPGVVCCGVPPCCGVESVGLDGPLAVDGGATQAGPRLGGSAMPRPAVRAGSSDL